MFAVIRTGGKQYRVATDDRITVMLLDGDVGGLVTFDEVLSFGEGAAIEIGTPLVAGATVEAEIVEQKRGPKVIAFKKRRRQNSRRKRGHRQDLTVVLITDILAAGQERNRRVAELEAAAHAPPAELLEEPPVEALVEAPAALLEEASAAPAGEVTGLPAEAAHEASAEAGHEPAAVTLLAEPDAAAAEG
jgi:large subunit ribosomal protein L21